MFYIVKFDVLDEITLKKIDSLNMVLSLNSIKHIINDQKYGEKENNEIPTKLTLLSRTYNKILYKKRVKDLEDRFYKIKKVEHADILSGDLSKYEIFVYTWFCLIMRRQYLEEDINYENFLQDNNLVKYYLYTEKSENIRPLFNKILELFINGEKNEDQSLFQSIFGKETSKLFQFNYGERKKIVKEYDKRYKQEGDNVNKHKGDTNRKTEEEDYQKEKEVTIKINISEIVYKIYRIAFLYVYKDKLKVYADAESAKSYLSIIKPVIQETCEALLKETGSRHSVDSQQPWMTMPDSRLKEGLIEFGKKLSGLNLYLNDIKDNYNHDNYKTLFGVLLDSFISDTIYYDEPSVSGIFMNILYKHLKKYDNPEYSKSSSKEIYQLGIDYNDPESKKQITRETREKKLDKQNKQLLALEFSDINVISKPSIFFTQYSKFDKKYLIIKKISIDEISITNYNVKSNHKQFWKDFKKSDVSGELSKKPNVMIVISQLGNMNKVNDILFFNSESMVISGNTINTIIGDLFAKETLEKTELTSDKKSDIEKKVKIIKHTDKSYDIFDDILYKKTDESKGLRLIGDNSEEGALMKEMNAIEIIMDTNASDRRLRSHTIDELVIELSKDIETGGDLNNIKWDHKDVGGIQYRDFYNYPITSNIGNTKLYLRKQTTGTRNSITGKNLEEQGIFPPAPPKGSLPRTGGYNYCITQKQHRYIGCRDSKFRKITVKEGTDDNPNLPYESSTNNDTNFTTTVVNPVDEIETSVNSYKRNGDPANSPLDFKINTETIEGKFGPLRVLADETASKDSLLFNEDSQKLKEKIDDIVNKEPEITLYKKSKLGKYYPNGGNASDYQKKLHHTFEYLKQLETKPGREKNLPFKTRIYVKINPDKLINAIPKKGYDKYYLRFNMLDNELGYLPESQHLSEQIELYKGEVKQHMVDDVEHGVTMGYYSLSNDPMAGDTSVSVAPETQKKTMTNIEKLEKQYNYLKEYQKTNGSMDKQGVIDKLERKINELKRQSQTGGSGQGVSTESLAKITNLGLGFTSKEDLNNYFKINTDNLDELVPKRPPPAVSGKYYLTDKNSTYNRHKLLYNDSYEEFSVEPSANTDFVENPLSKDVRDLEEGNYTERIYAIQLIHHHIKQSIFRYSWVGVDGGPVDPSSPDQDPQYLIWKSALLGGPEKKQVSSGQGAMQGGASPGGESTEPTAATPAPAVEVAAPAPAPTPAPEAVEATAPAPAPTPEPAVEVAAPGEQTTTPVPAPQPYIIKTPIFKITFVENLGGTKVEVPKTFSMGYSLKFTSYDNDKQTNDIYMNPVYLNSIMPVISKLPNFSYDYFIYLVIKKGDTVTSIEFKSIFKLVYDLYNVDITGLKNGTIIYECYKADSILGFDMDGKPVIRISSTKPGYGFLKITKEIITDNNSNTNLKNANQLVNTIYKGLGKTEESIITDDNIKGCIDGLIKTVEKQKGRLGNETQELKQFEYIHKITTKKKEDIDEIDKELSSFDGNDINTLETFMYCLMVTNLLLISEKELISYFDRYWIELHTPRDRIEKGAFKSSDIKDTPSDDIYKYKYHYKNIPGNDLITLKESLKKYPYNGFSMAGLPLPIFIIHEHFGLFKPETGAEQSDVEQTGVEQPDDKKLPEKKLSDFLEGGTVVKVNKVELKKYIYRMIKKHFKLMTGSENPIMDKQEGYNLIGGAKTTLNEISSISVGTGTYDLFNYNQPSLKRTFDKTRCKASLTNQGIRSYESSIGLFVKESGACNDKAKDPTIACGIEFEFKVKLDCNNNIHEKKVNIVNGYIIDPLSAFAGNKYSTGLFQRDTAYNLRKMKMIKKAIKNVFEKYNDESENSNQLKNYLQKIDEGIFNYDEADTERKDTGTSSGGGNIKKKHRVNRKTIHKKRYNGKNNNSRRGRMDDRTVNKSKYYMNKIHNNKRTNRKKKQFKNNKRTNRK